MIIRVLLLGFAMVGTVQAAAVPQGSDYDNRIQLVNYNPLDLVLIHASPGVVSRIVLEQGESILAHPTGFDAGYSITARGHILYIKPITFNGVRPNAREWSTNLLIETDKRLYDFELRLAPPNDKAAFYRVQFNYPIEAATQRKAQAVQVAAEQAKQAAKAAATVPTNIHYSMVSGKRSESIEPNKAYSDTTFTYLRFPLEIPAVFVVNQDGTESRVNSHIDPQRPDVVVVHRLARQFVLRLGSQVVTIHNNGYRH